MKHTPAFALALSSLLTACSTGGLFGYGKPTQIYYKDGRPAFVAECDGPSWGGCLAQAGAACRTVGYEVLEKNTAWRHGEEEREMVFACKGDPDAAERTPQPDAAAKTR